MKYQIMNYRKSSIYNSLPTVTADYVQSKSFHYKKKYHLNRATISVVYNLGAFYLNLKGIVSALFNHYGYYRVLKVYSSDAIAYANRD